MTEREIIEYATAILLTILVCGVALFITFLPQIDRWLEKRKRKRA